MIEEAMAFMLSLEALLSYKLSFFLSSEWREFAGSKERYEDMLFFSIFQYDCARGYCKREWLAVGGRFYGRCFITQMATQVLSSRNARKMNTKIP